MKSSTVASNTKTGYLSVRSTVPTWLIVNDGTACQSSVLTTFYNSINPDVVDKGDQIQLQSTGQYKSVTLNGDNLNQLKPLTLIKNKVSTRTNDNFVVVSTSASLPVTSNSSINPSLLFVLIGVVFAVLVVLVAIVLIRYRRKATEQTQVHQQVETNV